VSRGRRPDDAGLVPAHLTGGVTSLPDEVPIPAGKDLDPHRVVADDSPALVPSPRTIFPIMEIDPADIPLEAGLNAVSHDAGPEAVLANPEIAGRRETTLRLLQRETDARRADLGYRADRVADAVSVVAEKLIAAHPDIRDRTTRLRIPTNVPAPSMTPW